MQRLEKLRQRLREEGPVRSLTWLGAEAKVRALDLGRDAIVLRVDLEDPRNHPRPRDRQDPLRIVPLDGECLPRLLEMLEAHAPTERSRVRHRFLQGMRGFVAEDTERGEPIGYTFYTPGSDRPGHVAHPDLIWLGQTLKDNELYAFDYFLAEHARGRGATFVRAVQEEQARLGYRAAYGYVYAKNRAALWLYRTTGWQEVRRIEEHRLFSRLAIVDDGVYWMSAHERRPILPAPLSRLAGRALGALARLELKDR